MKMQKMSALVVVELKKLYRDPMSLAVMLLMPVGLALIFYLALSGVTNDYYPVPGMNHFEYLLPGVMGYAVIYMGMMVALALCRVPAIRLAETGRGHPGFPIGIPGKPHHCQYVHRRVPGLDRPAGGPAPGFCAAGRRGRFVAGLRCSWRCWRLQPWVWG